MNKEHPQIIAKNIQIGKNASINKSAKITCKSLWIGDGVKIEKDVELQANAIEIKNNSVIGSGTKIFSEKIKIGYNSKIADNSNIFTIEIFAIGDRSNMCVCHVRGRNVNIGNDFFSIVESSHMLVIGGGGSLLPTSNLSIGNRCTVNDCSINIAMPIKIGNDVGISTGVKFFTHYFWNSIFEGYPQKFAGITVSDGCIIGAESFFLPGVVIGTDCIVAARSVVTKTFPSNSMIGGNPAKIIKRNYKKTISTKKRIDMIKSTLKWYCDILKTKGFTIDEVAHNGLKYVVTDKRKISTTILYFSELRKMKKFQNSIVITFQDLPISAGLTIINLKRKKIQGLENELTDDLRDFLRKVGIRIFSERKFRSIVPVVNV